MKIAIHHRKGSFSDRWIEYCKENSIDYKLVDAFSSDIIEQVKDCDAFMWHHDHNNYKDVIVAKKVLFALEHSGKVVYPNFKSGWHFDDKIAQKYLLESIDAPLVPSYVFYDKNEALKWLEETDYPKVFKLKGGSGSSNVSLIKTKKEAKKLVRRSFKNGISGHSYKNYVKEKWRHFKEKGYKIKDLLKIVYRFFVKSKKSENLYKEKNYVYFQDFIENEGFDVRVVVIGEKAVALKRKVRENDFRASGSGKLVFENEYIDKRYISSAFNIANSLTTQTLSIDYIMDKNGNLFIVEISYGFPTKNFIDLSDGYWDSSLMWHKSKILFQDWIISNVIREIEK